MTIKKFRSFEAAERDLWTFRPDSGYFERLRAFYNFAARFQAPLSQRGVLKFRTMEEANSSAMQSTALGKPETLDPKPEISNTGLSDELLFEIVEAVRRESRPLRIILFGSRARGEWNDRSDIDIAVVLDGDVHFHPSLAADRIRTLLKVDILDFRTLNNDFQKEIAENGIVIYEAA